MVTFTIPPEGVTGPPINLQNADRVQYTAHRKYMSTGDAYEMAINAWVHSPGAGNCPPQEDYLIEKIQDSKIDFILPTGTYTWTKLNDESNTLEEVYNQIIAGTYPAKTLKG